MRRVFIWLILYCIVCTALVVLKQRGKIKQVKVELSYTYLVPKKLPELFIPDTMDIPNGSNNPGNITPGVERYDTLAIGFVTTRDSRRQRFLVFPTPDVGEKALSMRVDVAYGETVAHFLKRYGGARYTNTLCEEGGICRGDKVGPQNKEKIINSIKKHEGWKGGTVIPFRKITIE